MFHDKVTSVLVTIACLFVIAVGALYIGQRVHYGCLFGNCALVMTK